MIRTSTVVYLILLLVLVGAYWYLRDRGQPADIELTVEPSPEITYLFSAEDGTPSSIRIDSKDGTSVEVARDAGNAWAMTEPREGEADQGAAEAAASQVTTMRIVDTLPDVDPGIVGLDTPQYILTLKFASGVERSVDVGVITPTESGYYVRDPAGQVVIVSRSAVDALLGLLENPPYAQTATSAPANATPEAAVSATAAP
jgi:hypothetical protein